MTDLNASELVQECKELAVVLGKLLIEQKMVVATAESCTGGLIGGFITDVPGSSSWFDRGFITYTNEAKKECLGVKDATLESFGAVSIETAREMAIGALKSSNASLSVSVTGIAGPTGAVPGKPIGTVCFGYAWKNENKHVETERLVFTGDREEVRLQTVGHAFQKMIFILKTMRY